MLSLVLAATPLGWWLVAAPSAARLKVVAVAAATTAIIASPQLAAMTVQAMAGGNAVRPAVLARAYFRYAAELPSLFAPSTRLARYGLTGLASVYTSHTPGESLATFGMVLSALALLGLAVSWRRRSAWLLALLWLAAAVFALGPTLFAGSREYVPLAQAWHGQSVSLLMPYTWLVRIPGLSALREADRIAFIGLVGASVLAGAAVEWLHGHARPLLIVVVALGALEAGWPGNPGQRTMPTALAALDHPIAADQSGSIVVDVPFGLRVGMSAYGMPVSPLAWAIATSDGHPRAVSYTSWVPAPTTAAIKGHPFYARLAAAQRGRGSKPAQIAAARADLRTLDVGWVLVWQSHPSSVLTRYLAETRFRFDYLAPGLSHGPQPGSCSRMRCGKFVDGPDRVSVYRLAGRVAQEGGRASVPHRKVDHHLIRHRPGA